MQGLWSHHFPTAAKPPATVSPAKSNGLWSEIFPPPSPEASPLKPNGAAAGSPEPLPRFERRIICRVCNTASCPLKTSSTPKNPGRHFYTCPSRDHNFFKWADEVNPDELVDVPYCGGCSAGVCRVRRETIGPNAGRILFMCRVKEGEGSCGYRVWQGELQNSVIRKANERIASSQSTRVNCKETDTTNTDLVEESRQCDAVKESLISAHCLTIRLDMSSVSIEQCWMEAAIRQNLTSLLQGWWGRLAFHPMPCLMTHASKQPTSYKTPVSPRDPITLTRSILEVECQYQPLFIPSCNAEISAIDPLGAALDVPSYKIHNAMSESISSAFNQAADLLQNDLLSLLDSMDVKDHEAMTRAAEATFSALDRLLFDGRDFKARVKELIHCIMSLAEIEQSMPENASSHRKLVEKCSSERKRLDEINRNQMEAVDTVTSNKKHLNDLLEEIANAREWLFQIEAEVSCCEVEMRGMESELERISKKKEVLEGKYMIASKELEKFRQWKEAEHDAAKAVFGRARALIRG